MPVEDFLKPENVKQTVEKTVKPRLTTAELTTIEVPGKPSPASMLEDNKTQPSKKRATRKGKLSKSLLDNSVKDITTKDSILIITEKPQAAAKIAAAIGNERKITDPGSRASYFEVKSPTHGKIIVASAVGHLFNLTYVKGQTGWPIFDLIWEPSYNKKNAAFTKQYYNLLKKLSKRAKEYIISTDYDVEGEVIGWNVLRFICNQQTAKRMKYSTLTKNELLQSFENPLSELDWGQAYAGEARHFLDWLYGINLSRALMSAIKTSGSFKILSIGRVQGPALKIIVDREKEIENFKSEPYWQVFAITDKEEKPWEFKHPKDIFNKEELKRFENIKEAQAETKKSEEKLPPPGPFDLTTLQREAYRLHKISPSQTLSLAQKLYLDGLISYPRTSSQKIPEAINPKQILKSLEKQFPEAKSATRKTPIEGAKSDPAHPSIYPTGDLPDNITEEELRLYLIIAKRFISCFSSDALLAKKRITLTARDKENKDVTFTASAIHIVDQGWTKVYPTVLEEKYIPDFSGHVDIDKIRIDEKVTQPPKRYTPASLVSILEKKNLGTKSTRSSIVDTLFDRGYLDGKSIKATPLGLNLIETLSEYSPIIIDENLTRELEKEMNHIQESKQTPSELEKEEQKIIEKVKKVLTDISKEFKAKEIEIGKSLQKGLEKQRQEQTESNTLMPCPTCKKGHLRIMYSKKTKRYFVACSAYPECKQTFSLPPNSLIKKSDKDCEECKFPKLLAIRKAKRPWEFCFNPNCPTRKAYEERRQAKEEQEQ